VRTSHPTSTVLVFDGSQVSAARALECAWPAARHPRTGAPCERPRGQGYGRGDGADVYGDSEVQMGDAGCVEPYAVLGGAGAVHGARRSVAEGGRARAACLDLNQSRLYPGTVCVYIRA
jgi:hypothetical protein